MAEQGATSEEEQLEPYRRVRDEIRAFVETLPGALHDVPPKLEGFDMPDCSQCSGCE